MRIKFNPSGLRQTTWHEYSIRFLCGGLITAIAGIIAMKFGPAVGGLFLAFPAILPASATLIAKHKMEKQASAGFNGTKRGSSAAGVDAAGAFMGSIGLFVFALLAWRFVTRLNPWLVLSGATIVWVILSMLIWRIRRIATRSRRLEIGRS